MNRRVDVSAVQTPKGAWIVTAEHKRESLSDRCRHRYQVLDVAAQLAFDLCDFNHDGVVDFYPFRRRTMKRGGES